MIVGAGDHQHLAQAEHGARLFGGAGELGRKIDRTGRDDRALSGHQARNGTERPDCAGIRQRNRGALEIGDLQLVGAGAGNDVVVSRDKLREAHAVRVLDVRNHQRAGAIFAGDVHCQSDVHLSSNDAEWLPLVFGESMVQRRIGFQRLDDGPGNQVSEAELALALQRALLVDRVAILFDNREPEPGAGRWRSGIERLAVMFSTIRAATPRSGIN